MSRRTFTPAEKELKDALNLGRLETIKRILTAHPDWLLQKIGGHTPLQLSSKKNVESHQFLRSLYPAAFVKAARRQDLAELKALSEAVEFEQQDEEGHNALHLVAISGLLKAAKFLLDNGAIETLPSWAGPQSEYRGMTPLVVAIECGNFDVASSFADSGSLEMKLEDGNTPLSWAIQTSFRIGNNPDIVSTESQDTIFLMDGKATPAYKNHVQNAVWLIENGADIHSKYESGITSLMMASLCSVEAVCKKLLQEGADTDAEDSNGNTALSLAKSLDVISLLHNVASPRHSFIELPPGGVVMAGSEVSGEIRIHLRNVSNKPVLEDVVATLGGYKLECVLVDYNECIIDVRGGMPIKPSANEILEITAAHRRTIKLCEAKLCIVSPASGNNSIVRGITEEQLCNLECGSELNFQVEFYDSTGHPSTGHVTLGGNALSDIGFTVKKRADGRAAVGKARVEIHPGVSTLDFLVNEESASGYPIDVDIKPGPTHASTCIAYGSALESAQANSSNAFHIEAHDRFANPRQSGGDSFTAQLLGSDAVSVEISAISFNPGSYRAIYSPTKPGKYKLHVYLVTLDRGAEAIQGSPFDVVVHNSVSNAMIDADLRTWLEEKDLGAYMPNFRRHGVTFDVLSNLSDIYLVEMGITEIGSRAKLMNAIENLRKSRDHRLYFGRYRERNVVHENEARTVKIVSALDEQSGQNVILKFFRNHDECDNEIYWLKTIHQRAAASSYVVKLLGHFDTIGEDNAKLSCIVLEHGSKSLDRLTEGLAVESQHSLQWFVKCAGACINYLHSIGIVHGDVKPSNLVLFDDPPRVKLIDMTSCSLLTDPISGLHSSAYCSPVLAKSIINSDPIQSEKSHDAWALMVTSFELFAGRDKLMDLFEDANDDEAILQFVAKHHEGPRSPASSPPRRHIGPSSSGSSSSSSTLAPAASTANTAYGKFYKKAPKTVDGVLNAPHIMGVGKR